MSQGRYVNGELVKAVYVVNMASGGGGGGGVTPLQVSGIVSGIIDGVLDSVSVGGTETSPNIELKNDGNMNVDGDITIGNPDLSLTNTNGITFKPAGKIIIQRSSGATSPPIEIYRGDQKRMDIFAGGAVFSKGDIKLGNTSGSPNLLLGSNGKISTINNIISGGDPTAGGISAGVKLMNQGTIAAARNSGEPIWQGRTAGSSPITSSIDSSGSAVFAGTVSIGGTTAANTIDEYEEGTWTPALEEQGGNTFSGTTTGRYVRCGDLAFGAFTVRYEGNSNIADGTQLVRITGFPFNTNGTIQEIPFLIDNRRNVNNTFSAYSDDTTGYRGVFYDGEIRLFNLETGAKITWADVKTPNTGPTTAFKGNFIIQTLT